MNWYKKAEDSVSIKDIIWAIDGIIIEEEMITSDALMEAEQKITFNDYSLSKAAQVSSTKKYPLDHTSTSGYDSEKWVKKLLMNGYNTREIEKFTRLPLDYIKKIKSDIWDSPRHRMQDLEESLDPMILKFVERSRKEISSGFNLEKITPSRIASKLGGVAERHIVTVLSNNDMSISQLAKERWETMLQMIIKLIKNNFPVDNKPSSIKEVVILFQKEYGHKITLRTMDEIFKYGNLTTSRTHTSDALIFTAFKQFLLRKAIPLRKIKDLDPTILELHIDEFVEKTGHNFGFIKPLDKIKLKEMLMSKIQLRERALEQSENQQNLKNFDMYKHRSKIKQRLNENATLEQLLKEFPNFDKKEIINLYNNFSTQRYPIDLKETHPSFHLTDASYSRPLKTAKRRERRTIEKG